MFVSGEIDLSNAGRLGDWLAVIINEGPPAVEIDLSRMTFMDSTGISAFVTARSLCDGKQVGFSLTNVQPNTRRVIAAVGLEEFLSVQS